MDIMTPQHARWNEFCEKLEGREGCDFKEGIEGDPDSITWQCKGGNDKTYAKRILKKMGNIDINASLDFFDKQGGHCDCEILFNVR